MLGERLIYPVALLAIVCVICVATFFSVAPARKAPAMAGIPAGAVPSTALPDDPNVYLAHVEPIRARIAEVTRKTAAGDFNELSPEQRPDMSGEELAEFQASAKVEAQKALEAIAQTFPTAEEHSKAAFEFEKGRATSVAFMHYLKAVELKPGLAEAHAGLGRMLLRMGQTKEAIEALQMAVQLAPSRPGWLVDLGLGLYTDGRLDPALEMYDKALKLKPDLARAYSNKAVVYWRKGDYGEAWRNVEKCRESGEEPPKNFVQRLARDSGRLPAPGGAAPETPDAPVQP